MFCFFFAYLIKLMSIFSMRIGFLKAIKTLKFFPKKFCNGAAKLFLFQKITISKKIKLKKIQYN